MKTNHKVITAHHMLVEKRIWTQLLLALSMLIASITGCKKFVEVPVPTNKIVGTAIFTNNLSAAEAVTNMYITLDVYLDGQSGLNGQSGLAADEFTNNIQGYVDLQTFYINNLSATLNPPPYWGYFYQLIYSANVCIEGLDKSSSINPDLKQQLLGEAKFMRAFCHFYLVNLYGDVPLVTTSDYRLNNVATRTSKEKVYTQIIQDLKDAQVLLGNGYVDASNAVTQDRIRPNKAAATAMLAKVYFYTGDWQNAVTQASSVISDSEYTLETNLGNVFLTTSKEAIWQLAPSSTSYTNTKSGYEFALTAAPDYSHPLSLNTVLISSFEPLDARSSTWVKSINIGGVTYFYPFKYNISALQQPTSQYFMILRLAEQYLIRAEAEAELGGNANLISAAADVNKIRSRAGLAPTLAVTQVSLLDAIRHERQVELFTELGDRWLDLKRSGIINSVMGSPWNECQQKGGTWSPEKALFPIPSSELLTNPNLTQNPGY